MQKIYKYKDTLFRNYLNDKNRLLSVCNALLGTDSKDPDEIEINTLEGIFFSQVKNDLSCIFRDYFMIIIEHQSSVNENMPIRMLAYVNELYKRYLGKYDQGAVYREKLLRLPKPRFFVFYNGSKREEEVKIQSLSDAFGGDDSYLQLKVKLLNINEDNNVELLERCTYLNHYCIFVNRVKANIRANIGKKEAILEAIDYCINNDVMTDYLSSKKDEVFDMIDFEFNLDEAKKVWREEAREEGLEQGIERGIEQGMKRGIEQGMERGIAQGREQGREEGREQGREEGREQGREEGREQGREEGREQGVMDVISKLLNSGFSAEKIAELIDYPVAKIEAMAR